ncbi:MAG TPA: DUF5597 domain-containing protein [Tepidisphaeraceae bacterium]
MPALPHLQTNSDLTTHLIVDDKPFVMLGGELGNSTASSMDSLASVWPTVRQLHLNTVVSPVYWELMEPQEGRFDFTLVDQLIEDARRNDIRLVLLWFGVWKNSMSTYVPAWVKQDGRRFPHAFDANGRPVEILSAFSSDTLAADVSAYTALLRHLREIDGSRHTVLMVQIENEIGFLGAAREHGPAADAAFAGAVPDALLHRLKRSGGTWSEVFGSDAAGEEIFMAWHYARYVEALAAAGKAVYPLPVYVNAALNRPGRRPGEYPSAGPLPHLLDVWRAAAPSVDLLCPDVYFFDFADWTEKYVGPGHPLFVPEAMRSSRAAANAMYAIGQQRAIGFSPFNVEAIDDPANNLLGQAYSAMRFLMPKLLAPGSITFGLSPRVRADGTMDPTPQTIHVGDYTLSVKFDGVAAANTPLVSFGGDPAIRGDTLPPSGGLIVFDGPDTYIVIGTGMRITHTHASGDQVGLLDVQEWTQQGDGWAPQRWLNGDQTNQGREVLLYGFGMQRVRLYRYR